MRILSLHIENFGGLRDFSFTPEEGLSTLLYPNGWGKSSLAVFIKAMLYGLPATARRSLLENERKRYLPWQGGAFGGSMDVLLGERRLRIERRFGEKEAADTLTLIDLDKGVVLPVTSRAALGEEWLGVDAAAYERSTYLSQRPIDENGGSLSIHAKLNRLIDATDDIGSFDRAMELLERQRKYYTMNSGRRGAIADEQSRLYELEEAYARSLEQATEAATTANALERLQVRWKENQAQIAALSQQQLSYHAQREQRAKLSHLEHLKALLSRERAVLQQAQEALGGELPTEEQLYALEQLEREMATTLLRAEQCEAMLGADSPEAKEFMTLGRYFDGKIPTEEQIDALRGAANAAQSTAQRWRDHKSNEATLLQEATDAPTQAVDEPIDWAKYRRFCLQYPTERAKCEQARDAAAAKMSEAEIGVRDKKRKGKRLAWAAGILAVIAVAVCLVMLAVLPAWFWLPLILGLLGALGCVGGRVRMMAAAAQEQEKLAAAQTALQQTQEKYDLIVRQWRGVCRRLERMGGVEISDAAQALEMISAQEAVSKQAAAALQQREETKMLYEQRTRELACAMQGAQATLRSLWLWGEAPAAQDAPVAVERLAQQAERCRSIDQQLREAYGMAREYRERHEQQRAARQALLAPYVGLPTQQDAMAWLREMIAKVTLGKENVKTLQRQQEEFVAQNGLDAAQMPSETTDADEQAIAAQLQQLTKEAQELQQEMTLTRRTMQEQSERAAAMDTLADEITVCRERLEQSRTALSVVQSAQKHLMDAKDALSGRYLQRMKDSFAAYLAHLTGEQDAVFTMDGSFSVMLRRAGAARAKEAFSTGQRDVISLCARLALVDAMFEEEAPFLVLDDPFANLDDHTTQRAMKLLHKAAEKYQILYLTCHSSRA